MLITKPQQINVQMHYQVYTNNSFILSDRWKKTFTAFLGDIRKSFKAMQCILNPNPKRNQLYPIISMGLTSRSDPIVTIRFQNDSWSTFFPPINCSAVQIHLYILTKIAVSMRFVYSWNLCTLYIYFLFIIFIIYTHIHLHYIYIHKWSELLEPLVNMIKGSCENSSALVILLIYYKKKSQKSNLSLEKNTFK